MSGPNPESVAGQVGELVDPAPKPTRRTFTAGYRARIVAEYENAPHGEKSAATTAAAPESSTPTCSSSPAPYANRQPR